MTLICMPAEPWVNPVPASVTAEADCGHEVFISPAGVMELLKTPNLGTLCFRCARPGARTPSTVAEVPQGIRDEFEKEMGYPLTDELLGKVTAIHNFVAWTNKR